MAKESVIALQKRFDSLISLLTICGADKLGIDDKDRAALIIIARNPAYKELCKSIIAVCDVTIEHLDTIRTFMQ